MQTQANLDFQTFFAPLKEIRLEIERLCASSIFE